MREEGRKAEKGGGKVNISPHVTVRCRADFVNIYRTRVIPCNYTMLEKKKLSIYIVLEECHVTVRCKEGTVKIYHLESFQVTKRC